MSSESTEISFTVNDAVNSEKKDRVVEFNWWLIYYDSSFTIIYPTTKSRQVDLSCIGKLIGEQLYQFENVPIKHIRQPKLAFTDLRWKSWAGLQMAQALTNIRDDIYSLMKRQMESVIAMRHKFERELLQIEMFRVSAVFSTLFRDKQKQCCEPVDTLDTVMQQHLRGSGSFEHCVARTFTSNSAWLYLTYISGATCWRHQERNRSQHQLGWRLRDRNSAALESFVLINHRQNHYSAWCGNTAVTLSWFIT